MGSKSDILRLIEDQTLPQVSNITLSSMNVSDVSHNSCVGNVEGLVNLILILSYL